jgi:hypothetical protein
VDELKRAIDALDAMEAKAARDLKAARDRAGAAALAAGLAPNEPHTADGGKTVFVVSAEGKFTRKPVRVI